MKLIECHIDNFGTLHNFDMQFNEDLNVIMHDNGWGKSTLAAFLKAMLYGYDNKRTKDLTENERKHYLPWQGGNYGGTLVFEKGGNRYKIIRKFGATARSDELSVRDITNGRTVYVDNVGLWLFKLDADAFKRSAFINQNTFNRNGSVLSFHEKLNALLGEASDVGAYDEAVNELTKRTKDYLKTGNRGYIGDVQRKLDTLLTEQKEARKKIESVENCRMQIMEYDKQLSEIEKQVAEVKKRIDASEAVNKEKDASLKLYRELLERKDALEEEYRLFLDTAGIVPKKEELDIVSRSGPEIKRIEEALNSLSSDKEAALAEIQKQLDELENQKKQLEEKKAVCETSIGNYIPERKELQEVQTNLSNLNTIKTEYDSKNSEKEELELQITAIRKIYGSNMPSASEISEILTAEKILNEAIEVSSKNTSQTEINIASDKINQYKSKFGNNYPEISVLQNVHNNVTSSLNMESNIVGLESSRIEKQSEIDRLSNEIKQIEIELSSADNNIEIPKPSVSVGCFIGAAAAAVSGIFFWPLFILAGVLAVLGIVLLFIYRRKKSECEEQKKAAEEEIQKRESRKNSLLTEKNDKEKIFVKIQDDIASMRKEAADLMESSLSYIRNWKTDVTRADIISVCIGLRENMEDLNKQYAIIESNKKLSADNQMRIEQKKNRLNYLMRLLPDEYSELSLKERVDKVIADIDSEKEMSVNLKNISGQVKQISTKYNNMLKVVNDFLNKCGVSMDEAEFCLENMGNKLNELDEHNKQIEIQNKRIEDFKKSRKNNSPDDKAEIKLKNQLSSLTAKLNSVLDKYSTDNSSIESWLVSSDEKIKKNDEFLTNRQLMNEQIQKFETEHKDHLSEDKSVSHLAAGNEDVKLLQSLEEKRDSVRELITRAEESINHSDETLKSYRNIVQQIRILSEEKQSAQKSLYVLKKSIDHLKNAKENLASRYIGQIESNFNQYLAAWTKNDNLSGIIDTDFNIVMNDNGAVREAEGYSSGYMDIIDFCMRMALIDTLFEDEKPFIIMDDPFVNLDESRLEHAMNLLKAMSAESQIIYFVCHPMRASEPSEQIDTAIERHKLIKAPSAKKKVAEDKKRYNYISGDSVHPVSASRKITNNIFTVEFEADNSFVSGKEYDVFFVDAKEKVLCDKKQITVSAGEVQPSRIRFCLNTSKATGEIYNLMIRDTSAGENDIVNKFGYEVALSFASEFDF